LLTFLLKLGSYQARRIGGDITAMESEMNTKSIAIEININQNGVQVEGLLNGYAYTDAGFLVGDFSGEQVTSEQATLLTAFTFTGCPIAARCDEMAKNPWVHTKGAYRGERTMHGDGFVARSSLSSVPHDNTINMALALEVTGTLPKIAKVVAPFQEVIEQIDIGHLRGSFDITFSDELGNLVKTTSTTDYFLDIDFEVAPAWRNITIVGSGGAGEFHQIEQIDLFFDKASAVQDLEAKLAVSAVLH
jgi:hypothetical protein